MEGVTTISTSVLVNGFSTDEFQFEQGIRQNDPFHRFSF